jgi:hypothetical protein
MGKVRSKLFLFFYISPHRLVIIFSQVWKYQELMGKVRSKFWKHLEKWTELFLELYSTI